MSKIIGIDLSLTGTGVISIKDGQLTAKKLIKTKPSEKNPKAETERLLKIKADIQQELTDFQPDLVVLEGLAFNARNTTALVQLAGLSYMVREALVLREIPFVIVAPTTLKKFIIGKGNAGKDLMLLEVFKKYGVSFLDDNIADAFALAQCGAALRNESPIKLSKPQMEVLTLLNKQYV